ncbi:YeiH family protein [Dongia soli]|uniref:YeiH family protein n=1 Tax=Dongia soli TaxID=600628 RepID=A0ABU5E7H5_9PROT|nr:YeiH family protein [Dongia soli]MDY0881811.1 YeiH family protein [Dongia soli]
MAESYSSPVSASPGIQLPAAVPGLVLATLIAVFAETLHRYPGLDRFNPMILAMLIGLGFSVLIGTPAHCRAGTGFAARTLLRWAIALLGLQLALTRLGDLGWSGILLILLVVPATFSVTVLLGRWLGVPRELRYLIAFGTSICGASAVMAGNTVVKGSEDEAAYGIACVTIFGTAAMLLYPLVPGLLGLNVDQFGLWAGATIHEIGQVVAAGYQHGTISGDMATLAKLSRVLLLAPVVMTVGLIFRRHVQPRPQADAVRNSASGRIALPWFILVFVVLAGINSLGLVPQAVQHAAPDVTGFMMAVALGAMGLNTDGRKLLRRGWRPLLLGFLASLFIGALGLLLVVVLP